MTPIAHTRDRPVTKLPPARAELFAEVATMIFVGALALLAQASGFAYILFPRARSTCL